MQSTFRQFSFTAMGGRNEFLTYHRDKSEAERALALLISEVRRVEDKFSRYKEVSVLSRINRCAGISPFIVDEETAALLNYAHACFLQSEGLFDITSGVLRRAWNFHSTLIPSNESIKQLLPLVGWDKVRWNGKSVFLTLPGMELDLGGIGKEYAVDRCATILAEAGFVHSLVNLSGDIRVCGPRPDGSPWCIGITDPRKAGEIMLTSVTLQSGAIATSGDYERRIEVNGKRYSHILNPNTAWPVSGVQSVSVIGESCLIAGSLTTTAMLHGAFAEKFLRHLGVPYLLVEESGAVRHAKSFPFQKLPLELRTTASVNE